MKKFISIFVIPLLLCACSGETEHKYKHKYKYVETIKQKDLLGSYYDESDKDTVIIQALNDSIAYMEAYQKFCISMKVAKDMSAEGMEFAQIPVRFALYNEEGEIVLPYIPQEVLDSVEAHIMGLETGIKEAASNSKKERQQPVDSNMVKNLSALFQFKKDEFDPDGKTWIIPKSAPRFVDMNGMFCYFMQDNDGVSNFRIQIQYYADNWLFIRKYQFAIDGKAYELAPGRIERDNRNGKIWEWCDQGVNLDSEKQIIKALSNAKNAKIKIIGDQYHHIRTIKQSELKSIKETLQLYNAMGGVL